MGACCQFLAFHQFLHDEIVDQIPSELLELIGDYFFNMVAEHFKFPFRLKLKMQSKIYLTVLFE